MSEQREQFTELNLQRLKMKCSLSECDGLVYIMPSTAQLFLDPNEPSLDHIHSMCSDPSCSQRTIAFLDNIKPLDTIYDFREELDVTYYDSSKGTYSSQIKEIHTRLNPPLPEVELRELTPRQENLINYMAYLLTDENLYKEF